MLEQPCRDDQGCKTLSQRRRLVLDVRINSSKSNSQCTKTISTPLSSASAGVVRREADAVPQRSFELEACNADYVDTRLPANRHAKGLYPVLLRIR